jgi:hypothetical protein
MLLMGALDGGEHRTIGKLCLTTLKVDTIKVGLRVNEWSRESGMSHGIETGGMNIVCSKAPKSSTNPLLIKQHDTGTICISI